MLPGAQHPGSIPLSLRKRHHSSQGVPPVVSTLSRSGCWSKTLPHLLATNTPTRDQYRTQAKLLRFALHAAEADAHRLRGNAFYQQVAAVEDMRRQDQEVAGRLDLTPPTVVHPALREDFRLRDSSPTSNLMVNQMGVNAAQSTQTPPLRLVPGKGFQGNPTDRNLIESFHEKLERRSWAVVWRVCAVVRRGWGAAPMAARFPGRTSTMTRRMLAQC
jgi:hypothetical protein